MSKNKKSAVKVSKSSKAKSSSVKKVATVKTPSRSPKMLRNDAISLRMDGNAFWNANGVAAKKALLSVLLAYANGKTVKAIAGPDNTLLHVSGACVAIVWKVSRKGDIYSRNCPESGRVTGLLSAFKAGGVKVSTLTSGEMTKLDARVGIDSECKDVYSLATK